MVVVVVVVVVGVDEVKSAVVPVVVVCCSCRSGRDSGSPNFEMVGVFECFRSNGIHVCRYEKPLLLQICRLLRGFTHPGTYFEASTEELALYRYVCM